MKKILVCCEDAAAREKIVRFLTENSFDALPVCDIPEENVLVKGRERGGSQTSVFEENAEENAEEKKFGKSAGEGAEVWARQEDVWEEADGALLAFLPEKTLERAAKYFAEKRTAVLAIVSSAKRAIAERMFSGLGVCVLAAPIQPAVLLQTLRLSMDIHARVLALDDENRRLKLEIYDLKLIDRAKCSLIQYLGMTEPEAHRYIEKQAMDRRSSRGEIARSILKTYES